ncbi:AfsR/SARP family transcriptional regulator [Micromonospora salmantinae]|uniref:AfsR/SARP family transcriptional regulator n=1 Tax=Micromonospora salmantinae TaxID=2911211 RepID=UPI0027E16A6C|nr:BTAD domain-containing putative transcriptional regulator [Micromonospora salmantinae]
MASHKFNILGPLNLMADGQSRHIKGRRQQVILAMLLQAANKVAPITRLVDAVWADNPPSTARSQVQIGISALRRTLKEAGFGDIIVTQSPGYLIRVADDQLDATVFEAHVEEARRLVGLGQPEAAISAYRRALALTQGPALADIDSPLVQATANRLDEQRIVTHEECIELELALGRHNSVIAELGELVAEYPLRERLRAQQMVALSRAGRPGEALHAYRDARDTSVEELGIFPGEDLQEIEHAILTGDESLHSPLSSWVSDRLSSDSAPTPRMLPAAPADFTGRSSVSDHMLRLFTPEGSRTANAVKLAAVAGPGGVGKTALILHTAHAISEQYPDGQLFARLQDDQRGLVDPAYLLELFLRALGVPANAIPPALEDRAALYRSHIASHRLLIVLDDVASEQQVLPLLPGSDTCAVLVSSRQRLTGLPGAHHVELGVLPADEALSLMARMVGQRRVDAEVEAAHEIVELCDGLPLALRIIGARIAARPHRSLARIANRLSVEESRLDELVHDGLAVRANILLTYKNLDEMTRCLLRRLALTQTPEFPGWIAAALLDTDLTTGENVLDNLVEAHLVDVVDTHGSWLPRFRMHDLVRLFAQEQLHDEDGPAEARDAVQRALGGWLLLAEAAHSRLYGGDYTVLHGDAPRWKSLLTAVDDLTLAPMEWFLQERPSLLGAVNQAARIGLDEHCWELAVTSVTLFEAKGYFTDWRETHRLALAETRRADNRRGQAAVLNSLGSLLATSGQSEEARFLLERAQVLFDEVNDQYGTALVRRNLAFLDRLAGQLDRAMNNYFHSLQQLRLTGDHIGGAHVLNGMAQIALEQGDHDNAKGWLEEALVICAEHNNHRVAAQVRHRLGEMYLQRDDVDAADETFRSVLATVREAEDQLGIAFALEALGRVRIRQDRLSEARELLLQAQKLSHEAGNQPLSARALLSLGILHERRGEPHTASRYLTEALVLFEQMGARAWLGQTLEALAELHLHQGDQADAAARGQAPVDALDSIGSREAGELRRRLAARLLENRGAPGQDAVN